MKYHSFEDWMKAVDAILVSALGVCSSDLTDKCWMDEYESGSSPATAVDELVGSLDDDDIEQTMMDELFG